MKKNKKYHFFIILSAAICSNFKRLPSLTAFPRALLQYSPYYSLANNTPFNLQLNSLVIKKH